MADEIELKLVLTADAADAIEAAAPFGGEAAIKALRSTYFDTPDGALDAAGFSLRIREAGGARIQTVKADGGRAAGLFARPEWERPVDGDMPVLDDGTPIRALLREAADAIAPAFTVAVERRIWMLPAEGGAIEVALDRGAVTAGDRTTPICEIEFELSGGSPVALFALARTIDAIAPVRLGILSKADRGYRLLAPPPLLEKAQGVRLSDDMTAGDAFRRIAQSCLRHYRLNEDILLDRREASALHQARVALRRLRTAIATHKPFLEDAAFDRLAGELRWLTAILGDARDIDVMLDRAPPGRLHDRLVRARDGAYAAVEAALATPRIRALMIDLAEWIDAGEWLDDPDLADDRDRPARVFAAKALDTSRRRVKKRGRHLSELDDEERHEVRKAAKKLRYAAEFFAGLFGEKRERRRHRAFVDALAELQDQLGLLNDLATAPQMLDRLGLADDPDAGPVLGKARRKKLLQAAAEAHDGLVDAKRFWR
jgi:triphosphatase